MAKVGSLCVVDEYAAAVGRVKVRVQKNDRDGELEEFMTYGKQRLRFPRRMTPAHLGNAEFFDIFLEIIDFFHKAGMVFRWYPFFRHSCSMPSVSSEKIGV